MPKKPERSEAKCTSKISNLSFYAMIRLKLLLQLLFGSSYFYPILDKHIIQLQDGVHRLINRNDYLHYKNKTNEGYMNIGELKYTMDADVSTANVTYFTTGRNPSITSRAWKDLTKTKHPFSNTRTGSMKMLL